MAVDGRPDSDVTSEVHSNILCPKTRQDSNSDSGTINPNISSTHAVTSSDFSHDDGQGKIGRPESTEQPSSSLKSSSSLLMQTSGSNVHANIHSKKSTLSPTEIPGLVCNAPPPLTFLPVPKNYSFPMNRRHSSVSDPLSDIKHRKGLNPRKGSTNWQKQRSLSLSTNPPKHRLGRQRNNFTWRDEANMNKASIYASSMDSSFYPQEDPRFRDPYPVEGRFADMNGDGRVNYSVHKNASRLPENAFNNESLFTPPVLGHDNNRQNLRLDNRKQHVKNGVHRKRASVSGDGRLSRYRNNSTISGDYLHSSRQNRSLSVSNVMNDTIPSNAYNYRKTRNSCVDNSSMRASSSDTFQQLRISNFPQIEDILQSSNNQRNLNEVAKASRMFYPTDVLFKDHPRSNDHTNGETGKNRNNNLNGHCNSNKAEKDINYLTRMQVGYGRGDTSSSERRIRYLRQNDYPVETKYNYHDSDTNADLNRHNHTQEQFQSITKQNINVCNKCLLTLSRCRCLPACPSPRLIRQDRHSHQNDKNENGPEFRREDTLLCQMAESDSSDSSHSITYDQRPQGTNRVEDIVTSHSKQNVSESQTRNRPLHTPALSNLRSTTDRTEVRSRRETLADEQLPRLNNLPESELSTLGLEIEEEMERARSMAIPVKHDRFPKSDEPAPNVSVQAPAPVCQDANGNIYKMVKNKGTFYFHRQIQTITSNPNYVIPAHITSTDAISAQGSEVPSPIGHSADVNGNGLSIWQGQVPYPVEGNQSGNMNVISYPHIISQSSHDPSLGYPVYSPADNHASPILYSYPENMNISPQLQINSGTTTRLNMTSENVINNASQNYPLLSSPSEPVLYTNFVTNQTYGSQTGQTILQNCSRLNTYQLPLETPLNHQQPPYPSQGVTQTFPVLSEQSHPFIIHTPVSSLIPAYEYNHGLIFNGTPSTNPPHVIAAHMAPTPTGQSQNDTINTQVPNENEMQQLGTFTSQLTLDGNNPVAIAHFEPKALQYPSVNATCALVMNDNKDATDLKKAQTFALNSLFTQEKSVVTDHDLFRKENDSIKDKVTRKCIEKSDLNLIKEIVEKFVETVRRTEKHSPVPLTEKQIAKILCCKSSVIIDEIMDRHVKTSSGNGQNYESEKEEQNSTGEITENTHTELFIGESDSENSTQSASHSSEDEVSTPQSAKDTDNAISLNNTAFPITFGYVPEIDGADSSTLPLGVDQEHDRRNASGYTTSDLNDLEFPNALNSEVVNARLQNVIATERRASIGEVSVEKRINYFENNQKM